MDHNVFILGAGFSRHAEFPLISDFKEKMIETREWLDNQGRGFELESVDQVLEFRRDAGKACEYINFEPNNIEHLFSLASAVDPSTTIHIQRAIGATLDYCDAKFRRRTPQYALAPLHNPGENTEHSLQARQGSLYSHFARLFSGRLTEKRVQNTLITFNYDMLLEDANDEMIESDGGSSDEKLDILKLHGSINWVDPVDHPRYEGAVQAIQYVGYAGLADNHETPLIVPPTWNKTLREPRLQQAWTRALEALKEANRIVIIGFSFPPTDFHFRFLLAGGLMGNYHLKQIVVVDPHLEDLQENLSMLFNSNTQRLVTPFPGTAESFITSSNRIRALGLTDRDYNFNATGKYVTRS